MGSIASLWLGWIASAALASRSAGGATSLLWLALSRLWVLGALPLLSYGAARLVPLRPMFTAAVAALTGELFLLALQSASGGEMSGAVAIAHLGSLVLGVFLASRAARAARRSAERRDQLIALRAAARREQYEAFAEAEAARLANRSPEE